MRLKQLSGSLITLPPLLSVRSPDERVHAQKRTLVAPWRRWYKTARWQRIRQETFLRDLYQCRYCALVEGNTARLICDHVQPHRGNEAAFWSGPFQTLCKPCHDSVKQAEERRPRG